MYKIHNTNEGKSLPIAMMDDKHLYNTINLFLDRLEQASKLSQATLSESEMKTLLFMGKPLKNLQKVSQKRVPVLLEKLYPYLAELFLRANLSPATHNPFNDYVLDIQKRLRELLSRTGALPVTINKFPALPHDDYDDEDDNDF